MKVARNYSHNLRHDWLSISDERGKVVVSIMANRSELYVDVTIDGNREDDYLKPRELAEILATALAKRRTQAQ